MVGGRAAPCKRKIPMYNELREALAPNNETTTCSAWIDASRPERRRNARPISALQHKICNTTCQARYRYLSGAGGLHQSRIIPFSQTATSASQGTATRTRWLTGSMSHFRTAIKFSGTTMISPLLNADSRGRTPVRTPAAAYCCQHEPF